MNLNHKSNPKISLIGAGNIGSTIAFYLATVIKSVNIVLFDIKESVVLGKALDIGQAAQIAQSEAKIIGTHKYEDIVDSDVIIVTAGLSRKPGMSREDLLVSNANTIKEIANNIKKYSARSFIIVVTNPLDAMVYLMHQYLGLKSSNMIVGMAGILDSARFNYFLAKELNVSSQNINSLVLGGHGDSMVPLKNYSSINGIKVEDLFKIKQKELYKISEIEEKTRHGGTEIVELMQLSAYFAPALSAITMCQSYLFDQKKILPCSAYLNGQYGFTELFVGVPIIIGSEGVESIIELELNEIEKKAFINSVAHIQKTIEELKRLQLC